jgi:PRTRC genetic system protein E
MFTKLNEILSAKDGILLRITKSEHQMSVTVIADKTEKTLSPFVITGTAEELDQNFIEHLSKTFNVIASFSSNMEEIEKEAREKVEKAKAEKAEKTEKTEKAKVEKAPPVPKPKKLPKGVDKILQKMKETTDTLMKDYCEKEITKLLTADKWTEEEINNWISQNVEGKNKEIEKTKEIEEIEEIDDLEENNEEIEDEDAQQELDEQNELDSIVEEKPAENISSNELPPPPQEIYLETDALLNENLKEDVASAPTNTIEEDQDLLF